MTRQSGIDNVTDQATALGLFQCPSDCQAIQAVLAHAELQSLCASLRQPRVVWAGDGTDRVLQEAKTGNKVTEMRAGVSAGVLENDCAHDNV